MFFAFESKKQPHLDEVLSYGLSNSFEKPFLFIWDIGLGEPGSESRTYILEEGEEDPFYTDKGNFFYEQWHSGAEFKDYLTVQGGERFNYSSVYYNQTCDVHPPLYYFILHTVCSFFPNTFSKWFSASINLLFYSLSLFTLFFIGRRVLRSDKKALLAVAVWGLSRAGISNAVFLRMYMLMTFLVLLLVYLNIVLIEKYSVKYLVLIFAVNIMGFLTQYYFYIFSFFLTGSVCVYMLLKKRIKQLIPYSLSVLGAVAAALAFYPAALTHLTNGVYTENTTNGLTNLFGKNELLVYLLQDFTGLATYDNSLLADLLPAALIILLLLFWIRICKRDINKKEKLTELIRSLPADYTILTVSTALSAWVTLALCPYMPFFCDRYIFAQLPLFSLLFTDIICFVCNKAAGKLKKGKYGFISAVAALAVFTVLSDTLNENRFLGITRNSPETEQKVESIVDGGIIYYVADKEYRIHIFAPLLMNTAKVYAAHELDDSLIGRINDNEINAETVYLMFEAVSEYKNGAYISLNKASIDFALSEGLHCDFEFVDDFYYGNNKSGDLYHLYKVNY
ncbi:MAG: glycosyltransferase family 39 protein [Bacteroides sp.]|nr:glycosyltransferase family 39 protein [Bacteroides sp.]